ncbi:MAG: hypothetical protein R2911_44900 [Caldilineaceae bacterium]
MPLPAGPLNADLAPQLLAEFERAYQELYERLGPPVPVEVLNWRVVSSGPQPELRLQAAATDADNGASRDADGGVSAARKGERPAYFPECNGYANTPIYDRYRLARRCLQRPGHCGGAGIDGHCGAGRVSD